MSDVDEESPCKDCGMQDSCDGGEMQFCCDFCIWKNGGEEPSWCDGYDPMDIYGE